MAVTTNTAWELEPPETQVLINWCRLCDEESRVEVLTDDFERYLAGDLAQVAFPELEPAQREIIISGTHPECWLEELED